jgi:hypothetical protein
MVVIPPVFGIREVLGLDTEIEDRGDSELVIELGLRVLVEPVSTKELPGVLELELELYVWLIPTEELVAVTELETEVYAWLAPAEGFVAVRYTVIVESVVDHGEALDWVYVVSTEDRVVNW